MGDFNQIESLKDKLGGKGLNKDWEHFMEFKLNLGLIDIPCIGNKYTWSNNRPTSEDLIMEKLVRAYISDKWLHIFDNSFIYNLPIFSSDHGPILVVYEIGKKGIINTTKHKLGP